MKLDRLETHDRLLHFVKEQSQNVFQGAEECLKKNTLSQALQQRSPYIYIFAHPRTHDDGLTKRMLWQPRLTKPAPQTNSYLFRAISNTDIVEVCWLLPARELWPQYKKGNVTENPVVMWSINNYQFNRAQMDLPEPDDLDQNQVANIYREVFSSVKIP